MKDFVPMRIFTGLESVPTGALGSRRRLRREVFFLYSVVCVLFVSNCLTADTKTKRFTLTTVTLHPDTTLAKPVHVDDVLASGRFRLWRVNIHISLKSGTQLMSSS